MRFKGPSSQPALLPLAIGGALCLAGAMGIGRFLYTPLLPVMVEALGLSKTDAGLLASANFVGYLAGALAAAQIRLPGSPHAQLLASLAFGVATTLAMAFTGSFPVFVALRFAGGLASAFVMVFASSLVLERLARARRGGLASIHFAGVGAGIIASALLAPGLAALGYGWRGMWVGGASIFAAAAIAAAWLVRGHSQPATSAAPTPAQAESESPPPHAERQIGKDGALPALLVLSYGLFGFGYVTTATFIVAIVRGAPATSSLEGPVWLAVGLAAMVSVAVWNRIASRYGVLRTYAAACLAEACGVAASVTGGAAGLFAGAVLLGGTFVAITALGLVAARSFSPRSPKRVIGLMTASFGVGQIVGPLVGGAMRDALGSFLLPSLLAAAALCVAAVLALAARRHERPA